MRHLRPCLSMLVAVACAAGCAPAGMAPAAPVAVAGRALTLDARQGDARAIGRVDLLGRAGRTLLAEVDTWDAGDIDHLDVAIYEYETDGETYENETLKDTTRVEPDQLEATLTFVGLRPGLTYRVRATAYASEGSGQPISDPALSYVDFDVYTDNRPNAAIVPVELLDVPFNGRATSNGLDIRDGGHVTAGPAFITGGRAVDGDEVRSFAGDLDNHLPGHVDDPDPGNVRFDRPVAIAAIGLDTYVAEAQNLTIRRMSPQGATTTFAGHPFMPFASRSLVNGLGTAAGFVGPTALAADNAGNLYVADSDLTLDLSAVRKITPDGQVTTVAGGARGYANGAGASAQFQGIEGIAFDRDHTLYISDNVNRLIRKLDLATGLVSDVAGGYQDAGGADGPAASATFFTAAGMAVDLDGNLLVCERGGHTIRKLTFGAGGAVTVSTVAGSHGAIGDGTAADDGVGAAARFNGPAHIVVDGLGNAYVTESLHRVRKLTFGAGGVATVTTLAGLGLTPGAADSTPPVPPNAARFNYPAGMAFDQAGRMHLADTFNHTIRIIGYTGDLGGTQ